jgi:shikimate dehydrogenase
VPNTIYKDKIAEIIPLYLCKFTFVQFYFSVMKKFGLIGYPLGHSFSKKYFEDKFILENLRDCAFELYPLPQIEAFKLLIATEQNLVGLAVTIPYKEMVIPLLTNISDAAKEIGAVNCIKFLGDETIGYNTDVVGFEKSLLPLLSPHHTKALVLGTGGASKAVQYILKNRGIDFLLVSRNKMDKDNAITYDELDEEKMKAYTLIVNCTPVGMTPNEDTMPALPYQYIGPNHLLYDLIYKPEKTKFLQEGEKHGSTIKNGFEMLIIQAEENWKIWNENMER